MIISRVSTLFSFSRITVLSAIVSLLLVANAVATFGQSLPDRIKAEEELKRFESTLKESQEQFGEEEEDVSGRHQWFMFQRSFPYGEIPAGVRADAIREVQAEETRYTQALATTKGGARALAGNSWENIGPFNIAGRIKAMVMHPTIPNKIFVGAAAGGIWVSTNGGGDDWRTTFDKQSALSMGAIAIDPTNPSIIYVGTGEILPNSSSTFNATPSYLGDGIFKSTDGGETWRNIGQNGVGSFSKIYVHSQKPNIIYAAAAYGNGGFYRSTDAGDTWTRTYSGVVYDLTVNQQNEDIVYLGLQNSIRRSTNAGETFSVSGTGFNPSNAIRVSVAVAPSNPDRLYALVARQGGSGGRNLAQVFRSNDAGDTWTSIRNFNENFFNAQGYYNNCIAIHPEVEDVVLIGGIDVFVSVNGGSSWENTTLSYSGGNVHPDQHVLVFDPIHQDVVYLGNDGGVYKSGDAGFTWERVSLSLPITQYYGLAVDQTRPFRVYGGSQDNGSHGSYGTNSYGEDWESISAFGGDGFNVVVDESNPNILYAESQYGNIYLVFANNPGSFQYISARISDSDPGMWSAPLKMSPADKKTLYSGRTFNLWRTSNRGGNWESLNPGVNGAISAIGLSPTDAGVIVVGSVSGSVAYTLNNGETWNAATGIPTRYIADLVFDPVLPGRVYAICSGINSGHVYRSDDNGATFVNITSNLRDIPTSAIAIDPENNNHLFVGNDVGVFVSLDGGNFWFPFNDGLPYAPVVDLEIHKDSRMLIAATHGRSMFRASIDNPQPEPVLISPVVGAPYTTPGSLAITWAGFDGPVRVLISYDGGQTYDTVSYSVAGDSIRYELPFIKTTNAIVKVESINDDRSVSSGPFSLSPKANTITRGPRTGVVAGAVAIRDGVVWAADRYSPIIKRFRLPLMLPTGSDIEFTGVSGTVVDMAYDSEIDQFYLLTANPDYTNVHVYAIDTTGVNQGEITLPATTISGITISQQGLVLVTPGVAGVVYTINPASGDVLNQSEALQGANGSNRVALTWDKLGFVQGINDARPGATYSDELQRLRLSDPPSVVATVPVITDNETDIVMYGLAYYDDPSAPNNTKYIVTDTAGYFYQLTQEGTSDVHVTFTPNLPGSVAIAGVSPNPFKGQATVYVALKDRQQVTLELFTTTGERIQQLFDGTMEAGEKEIGIRSEGLSSGIYYLILSGSSGERDITPVLIVK